MKASGLARAILSQDQINELVLMRDGKLVVATPSTIFVDSPSESTKKQKNKRELANNAGSRVLRQILSTPNKGLRNAQEI